MMRGGMIKNMLVVAAAVTILMLMKGTTAETLTVGDNNEWSRPSSSDFYSSWAAKHTFTVGDTLGFNFLTGSHTVVKVTSKDAYENCDPKLDAKPVEYTSGPANIPLTSEGEVFFICTIGSHCIHGQKLAINVVAAANAKPLGPASSQTPDSHKDTGSAPKSMALTLTTFSLSLMALVMASGYY